MIPFRAIFEKAVQHPTVQKVAAGVAIVALLSLGTKFALGEAAVVTLPSAQKCGTDLADRTARLELTAAAMSSCSKALDLCTGTRP